MPMMSMLARIPITNFVRLWIYCECKINSWYIYQASINQFNKIFNWFLDACVEHFVLIKLYPWYGNVMSSCSYHYRRYLELSHLIHEWVGRSIKCNKFNRDYKSLFVHVLSLLAIRKHNQDYEEMLYLCIRTHVTMKAFLLALERETKMIKSSKEVVYVKSKYFN